MTTAPAPASAPAVSIRKMPAYIPATWIYEVAEMSEHVVRYHLKKLGVGEVIGAKLVVSKIDLRKNWPSVYGLIEAALVAGRFDRSGRKKRTPPRGKKAKDDTRQETTAPETVRSGATPADARGFLQVALRVRGRGPPGLPSLPWGEAAPLNPFLRDIARHSATEPRAERPLDPRGPLARGARALPPGALHTHHRRLAG